MSLGQLMVDLRGTRLEAGEREVLAHPMVGGVILFTRNYESPAQLRGLVEAVHGLRHPRLLVGVDHEGGPVQRFREGFTRLPAAAVIGERYDTDRAQALRLAEDTGWLMAAELRAAGVDFSFAPVLDLGRGVSQVIGERAFHRDPEAVAALARAWVRGMHAAGMAAVGKHFPGHGSVEADSHHALPVDPRPYAEIEALDLLPFRRLAREELAGIMPAHVVYSAVDQQPAGFSAFWLQRVLRERLGFQGTIFSDDICMEGAAGAGSHLDRAEAALEAGCDMVLVCNDPEAAARVVEGLRRPPEPRVLARLIRMHGRRGVDGELAASARWRRVRAELALLDPNPQLALGDDATV